MRIVEVGGGIRRKAPVEGCPSVEELVGEMVRLANPSPSEPASLLAFFAPPGFARALAAWPEEA